MFARIEFEIGAEWAPDSPFGFEHLSIEETGQYHYWNRCRDTVRSAEGSIPASEFYRIEADLRNAGFPQFPDHAIPPGGSLIAICIIRGGETDAIEMDYHAALSFPSYARPVRRLMGWLVHVRPGDGAG